MSTPDERPLTTDELRLISSWASGDRTDEDLYFLLRKGLLTSTRDRLLDGNPVAVSRTRPVVPERPPVQGLTVRGQGLNEVLQLADEADALFWSEASVTKFLFPFLSSLSGHRANEVLRHASAAWQNYPSAGKPCEVYALAHVPGSTAVTPSQSVQVIFREGNGPSTPETRLETLAVDPFLERFDVPLYEKPVVAPPKHDPEETRAHTPLSAHSLRVLAEWAAGVPGELLRFAYDGEGWRLLPEGEKPGPRDFVVPAFTPLAVPERPSLREVTLRGERGQVFPLARDADAVFWSEGAVEQFMLPYYTWKGGNDGALAIEILLGIWDAGAPIRLRVDDANDAETDVDVIAMVHLPKSEYVKEPGGTPGLHTAGVVARHVATGVHEVFSVETFVAAQSRASASPRKSGSRDR